MTSSKSITRVEFVRRFMQAGFSYVQAGKAYDTMCEIFEDSIVSGDRINVGRVCSLSPTWLEPREVSMGFQRTSEGVVNKKRVYCLGRRIRYRVNLYKEFMKKHTLNWF